MGSQASAPEVDEDNRTTASLRLGQPWFESERHF